MPRASKYETYVKPHLEDIRKWVLDLNEKQIAEKLGITQASLENYKKKYPELAEVLIKGRQDLVLDLKDSLRKKARGFYYTETKTTIKDENGKKTKYIEKHEKYAQPDTGAIHLLLKNLDEEWHNDDAFQMEMKRLQAELDRDRLEAQKW
ncbi:MAG: hypothetical protein IIY21_00350 [Clostridiales bacterium]|nr:hypothetical protein [Clostridiales bacterium]MBQ1572384.1 hypothetical protein [Clostridiales bacterium]